MSFTQNSFSPVSNSSAAPAVWSYKTDDLLSETLSIDYFIKKVFELNVGDLIWCVCSDGSREIRYMGAGVVPYIVSPKPLETILIGRDITVQNPTGLDAVMQVSYGDEQITDDATLGADGSLTFHKHGFYHLVAIFSVGRLLSAGGIAHIFLRALLNGVQVGSPLSTFIDNTNIVIPEQFVLDLELNVGDVFTVEIYRDSNGANDGGLLTSLSTIGWGTAASATIRLKRAA